MQENGKKEFVLRVRLAFEPDRLNPMLSALTQATQIERKIFLPLADYNPNTLILEPILMTESPKITQIVEGPYAGGAEYDLNILPGATWDDGTSITGFDYAFTMKAALNPFISNVAWQSHMDHIVDIVVDSTDSLHIKVITDTEYILSESVIITNPIYPAHIYDPDQMLAPYSFSDIKQLASVNHQDVNQRLKDFADQFNSDEYSRTIVQGAGPYEFVEWIPNQQIILQRKDNWWGNRNIDKHPLMESKPTKIIYYFIPDAQTAITALKDGRIDVVAELSPEQYIDLESYNVKARSLTLRTAPLLQYYFIAYNNDHAILNDKRVRKAISHLMDIQTLADKLFFGLATPTHGPIIPELPAYDTSLASIAFDPETSNLLLAEAGWTDSNGNGILDKNLNGTFTELSLTIMTSRSRLSQDVAILLKEQAQQVGIFLEIMPLDLRNLVQTARRGEYDMACLASVQEVGPYDPYNTWHSDNASTNGNNWCKFRNPEADKIIEKIGHTLDEGRRNELYKKLQRIIFEDQPALFLVSPKFCMATNKHLIFNPTAMRPGYFENTFSAN
ncbi:MAG: hypothetical protein HKN76_18270 [Saprospiraceae bacterium]|nr:hypothetical protein [Saprospiraceae bacterium]